LSNSARTAIALSTGPSCLKKQPHNRRGQPIGLSLSFSAAALALTIGGCSVPPPLAPACRPWQSGTGTEPPAHCLFFPGSVAMDPLGDLLYVSNTNADLSFGGATLVAVDILRHERAVECF